MPYTQPKWPIVLAEVLLSRRPDWSIGDSMFGPILAWPCDFILDNHEYLKGELQWWFNSSLKAMCHSCVIQNLVRVKELSRFSHKPWRPQVILVSPWPWPSRLIIPAAPRLPQGHQVEECWHNRVKDENEQGHKQRSPSSFKWENNSENNFCKRKSVKDCLDTSRLSLLNNH